MTLIYNHFIVDDLVMPYLHLFLDSKTKMEQEMSEVRNRLKIAESTIAELAEKYNRDRKAMPSCDSVSAKCKFKS